MRKFTLILASLFLSLGTVWAQTPVVTVTEIGAAPHKLSDEDAAKIFGLENLTVVLDVTTAASLSGRGAFFCVADPAEAVPSTFSGTNTSYMACGHNGAGAAYLAAAKDGQHFSTGTIPANSIIRLAYVFDKINNKFKIYIGDTNTGWTMDRNFGNYEIATPKMVKEDFENAKIYIGGGMVNNNAYELGDATIHAVRVFDGALSVNEIKAVDYVKTADDFVNGKIYTFETQRGWMGAKGDVDNVISSAYASNGVTGSKDEANFQWTVYKSVNGYNYLYNVGKKKFMGVQSSNNTAISFVDAPAGKNLTFKTSGNVLYPLMFSTDGNAVVNHSTDRAPGLISWTGGWNNLNDGGSNHRVVAVGELDANTFATIKAAVEAFEVDNTQEVAALDAAIVKAENFFGGIKLGSGMGQYTATDADYLNKFAGIKTFRAGIVDINTPTPADIKEKIDELETIIASVQLNLPMAGKYYRILAVDGHNDDARYLGAQNKTETTRAEFVADADVNTIFYFDGTYLLSYASNMYLANNNGFIGYNESNKIDVEFQAAAKGLIGAYNLTYNSQERYMYCHANDNRTDGGGSTNDDNGYCFNLEEVEESELGLAGAGTEASPYLINSLNHLILFRNSVNAGETTYNGKYVALGANIDLAGENWTPIGNAVYNNKYQPVDASKVFSGVFDGKGKVISNLNVSKYVGGVDEEANVGLFAVTGAGAVIKDLILTNVNIETDGRNVGALAGFAYMATLSNITVNGNIQIKGGNNVAGVAAMTRYHAMSATNISVSGADGSAIVGNNIVGGIFAEIAPNGSTQKFDGLNVENVAITGAGGVGGIVGLLTTGAVENVSVKNVVLTGRTDYQGNAMGRIRLGSVAGLMGGKYATIANEVVQNVTAKNLNGDAVEQLPVIGANYDASSNATEAKIGDTYYATFDAAMAAQGNDDVELLVEKAITLDDANAYTYTKGADGVNVEYSRNLIPSIWNPVYIPFDATVPAAEFEVAEFTAAEGTTITLTKLVDANEDGDIELSANTAYVVRPIDGYSTLSLGAWGYIHSNEEVSPLSLGEGFSVRGNYNVLTGAKLAATDRVVGSNGNWGVLKSTSTLKPYRLILSVPESFSAEQNAISFSMRVLDNTTGVEETIFDGQETIVIFDLMGRRVESITEGGIYIVNGKKIVF